MQAQRAAVALAHLLPVGEAVCVVVPELLTEELGHCVAERVGLVDDGEVGGGQGTLDLLDEAEVRDGRPRGRGERSANGFDVVAGDGGSAAVKNKVTGFHDWVDE
jgi:hypothetical protein